ncbi:hypothetical protein BDN70DRAFT_936263 [Pholiota conissans]|uniref:Uncharacterized protein n=1 Tax=Pholiota conissans TaxID=109636 RepID=A0A9P5YSX8_9AGAR|nr:hypothetical protein BDN70DRAFT_936263 [Pholiota conissans]
MSSSSLPRSSPSLRSSSPTINLTNPEETAELIATYKRQLNHLSDKLAQATQPQPKRPTTTKTLGRGIRKLVTLFDNLLPILDEAERRKIHGIANTNADPQKARIQQRTFRSYPIFLQLVPQVKTVALSKSLPEINDFLADSFFKLEAGANSARSDDIKRVKEDIAAWINKEYKPVQFLERASRDNRGLQHDVCGRLLTPIMFNWDDLEVRANIQGSKEGFIINSNYYLRCLYPKGDFDVNRIERNLLRGKLLVYCSIFTSPSSAEGIDDEDEGEELGPARKKQKSARATKSCVASLLNMDGKVTGRSIAYAAVLMVFNLTNAVSWTETYNNFSFIGFYNFLVDYFEEERSANSTRRVKELLEWWNDQVFPEHVASMGDSDESRELLLTQDDDY